MNFIALAKRHCIQRLSACVLFALATHGVCRAEEYFDRYGLSANSASMDMGAQPLGYPSGVVSAVMQRDNVLKKMLLASHYPLKTHYFLRGADIVPLLSDRKLKAGLLGDMPTLLAASAGTVWVVGVVKQTSTAIVAKNTVKIANLVGKRIGYVPTSSAHLTLLQGLASAGISESQITLVPLIAGNMPDALEHGDIDAFAAWEPDPTIALGKSSSNHIVFRGLTTDYFVIEKSFAKQSPQAARHVVAGFWRAIEWMRRSQENVEKAAQWARQDSSSFSKSPPALSVAQIADITRRELLDIPSAPTVLINPTKQPLKIEFQFLNALKKVPLGHTWANVEEAFTYDGLAKVLAEPRTYQIRNFEYEN